MISFLRCSYTISCWIMFSDRFLDSPWSCNRKRNPSMSYNLLIHVVLVFVVGLCRVGTRQWMYGFQKLRHNRLRHNGSDLAAKCSRIYPSTNNTPWRASCIFVLRVSFTFDYFWFSRRRTFRGVVLFEKQTNNFVLCVDNFADFQVSTTSALFQ